MKKHIFPLFIIAAAFSSSFSVQAVEMTDSAASKPTVYFTSDISPEGLLEVYHALGVKPEGKVAVKISTGESSKSNHLSPELIDPLRWSRSLRAHWWNATRPTEATAPPPQTIAVLSPNAVI